MNSVYVVSIEMVRSLRGSVAVIGKRDPGLADQLRRAGTSVVLNIAEANGCTGGNARMRFRRPAAR